MAVLGTTVPTLLDLAKTFAPDGSFDADRVNLLAQTNEMLADMVWKEGNLPTGHRTTVLTGLPTVAFRRINEGVPLSKSSSAQIDETAAMLEGFSQVDRQLAIMSGNINRYRFEESQTFMESMNQTLQSYMMYGNSATNPAAFTGFGPRYNNISGGANTSQIIDAGGVQTDNTSIWLIGWGNAVHGIYPKNTLGGLRHEDATSNRANSSDGWMSGDVLLDANGNPYMGYRDHFQWNCGLAIRDYRAIVRIANIDVSNLVTNSSAADVINLMIRATYKIPTNLRRNRGANGFGRPAFYVNSTIKTALHLQALTKASYQLTVSDVGGEEVLNLLGIPIREVDQILNTEARVV